jgi:hypothetical protein
MLIRFEDLVSASLFAARKNDEGYFAEILHLHSGHMYGPLPIMGFAVIVSEYAAGGDDVVPQKDVSIPWIIHILGVILCTFSLSTIAISLSYLLWIIIVVLFADPLAVLVAIFILGICILLLVILVSILVSGLMKMIPVVREGTKFHHYLFRITMVIILLFTVVFFQV